MKKIGLTMLLVVLVFISFAGEEPKLFREISRKTIIDLSDVALKNGENYAEVIFSVTDKRISIYDINATQKELRRLVRDKLESMVIRSEYEKGKLYKYRFVFEKE